MITTLGDRQAGRGVTDIANAPPTSSLVPREWVGLVGMRRQSSVRVGASGSQSGSALPERMPTLDLLERR
jgi:hypothetical protein